MELSLEQVFEVSNNTQKNRSVSKLTEAEFIWLDSIKSLLHQGEKMAVLFSKTDVEGNYIDCHIVDVDSKCNRRFIIAENYQLSPAMENLLDYYAKSSIKVAEGVTQKIHTEYQMRYPDIHLLSPADYENPIHLISHIYYSLHKGSIKEKLYKAGLHQFALHLNTMEYNMIGTTPSAAFYSPIGVLRALNTPHGITFAETDEKRANFSRLYKVHPECFKEQLNEFQCAYICDELDTDNINQEDVRILSYLHQLETHTDYADYMQYLIHRNELSDFIPFPLIPEDSQFAYFKAQTVFYHAIEHGLETDKRIKTVYRSKGQSLEYEDEEYQLRFPRSCEELCKASETLSNCLWGYIERTASGTDIPLLLYQTDSLIGSIEIDWNDKALVQAKGWGNNPLPANAQRWLKDYVHLYDFTVKGFDI